MRKTEKKTNKTYRSKQNNNNKRKGGLHHQRHHQYQRQKMQAYSMHSMSEREEKEEEEHDIDLLICRNMKAAIHIHVFRNRDVESHPQNKTGKKMDVNEFGVACQ